jgi:hypothetical protein
MASPKLEPAIRGRTGSPRSDSGPGSGQEPPIGPARWAGVALVIVALIGAVGLAVVSPSDDGGTTDPGGTTAGVTATASPPASPLDTRLPVARPEIVSPKAGWIIGEWYIDVDVAVPEGEALPKRLLSVVVLRGDEVLKSLQRPEAGRTLTVSDVPLVAGTNELTAALQGPGGLGPVSETVSITQDRDAPVLRITAPKAGTETLETTIEVTGTSEPGASVAVSNGANRWDADVGVGPAGSFEVRVPLAMGRNRIVVRSTDAAGMEQLDDVVVVRKDGRPKIKISAPKQVSRADLPKLIRIVVDVSDANGDDIRDAVVTYTLGGPGWTAQDFEDRTDANGRSTWEVELVAGGSGSDPTLGVEVIAPNGERSQDSRTIVIP